MSTQEFYAVPTPDDFKEKRLKDYEDGTADQLRRVTMHARCWILQIQLRETEENHLLGKGIPEWHVICEPCGRSVLRVYSNGQPFNFRPWEVETATIRHLYHCHEEIARGD